MTQQVFESIESICQEIEDPVISEYEFFTESHGVKIYRQYNEKSGLYTYKVYGVLEDVSPEVCAQVYLDIEYRKIWDKYVKDLYEVTEGNEKAIYWRVAYPFPMSHRDFSTVAYERTIEPDREATLFYAFLPSEAFSARPFGLTINLNYKDSYVYRRDYQKLTLADREYHAVLAQSVQISSVAEKSGVIRVTDYLQQCALTGDGKGGTKAFMKYYDDPGGMIPTWLINWAAKTGVPGFLKEMQKACKGYPQYLTQRAATT